ncbi:MAG: hypothetical protein KBG47_10135 [Bacteroidia bacterium]|nr:hypothetical protein [Sphingobacteriaceae bacterium]MBP9069858.1 hypothetical protein [Bacteroidia bacterium]
MKKSTRLTVLLFVLVAFTNSFFAQAVKSKSSKYPTSFTIDKASFDKLFTYKVSEVAKSKTNKYINGSTVLLNSAFMENKQLKLKLSYFKNAELFVQINGKDSKIIYIMSSDNSIFYNSKTTDKGFILTQCQKDDILSE